MGLKRQVCSFFYTFGLTLVRYICGRFAVYTYALCTGLWESIRNFKQFSYMHGTKQINIVRHSSSAYNQKQKIELKKRYMQCMVRQFRAADVQWSYICYCQVINQTLVSILYLFQKFPKCLFNYLFFLQFALSPSEHVFLVCQNNPDSLKKTNKQTCMYISCLNILLKYNQPTDILWSLFCSETSIRFYVFIKWMILLYYDLLFIETWVTQFFLSSLYCYKWHFCMVKNTEPVTHSNE